MGHLQARFNLDGTMAVQWGNIKALDVDDVQIVVSAKT